MAAPLDLQRLSTAFQSRPDIIDGIRRAADSPGRIALFNEITSYVHDQLQANGEPALKRRKVDNGGVNGAAGSPAVQTNAADEDVLLEVKEISVAVPQRKKFELCFTAHHIYARAPGTTAPIPAITHAWSDIEYAFYLPVPDKAQVQHNYVLFPRGTCLPSKTNPPTTEPLVFTVPATPPKQGVIGGAEAGSAAAVSDTYKSLFHWAFDRRLKGVGSSVTIVSANPNKFHSMIRQPHRPNEKAVHVTGFRGSKDGFLFFLENGIFWGFKKPLMFMPLERIVAVSYTNILQITFNMVVEVMSEDGEPSEELEFGMLDQQDYGGIDDYIKTNRLQDRSMAEQRKGKLQLAENRKKGAEGGSSDGANGHAGENGTSELALAHLEAEQLLQDEEDEDEEDYDPGSEGDSEGSGESSDDDDDDDDEDDEDDEDEEDGDGDEEVGDADAEGDEAAEEEEEEDEPEEEPQQQKVVQPPPQAAPAPSGWAAFTSRPSRNNKDTGEKFDVV